MNVLGLCAGIGGLELGLHLAKPSATPVCFVERDKFGQSVLAARWPNAIIHDDIFTLDTTTLPRIDIVTAGFPCQPWSSAGLRKGINDDRWILPEILNIVRKVGPRFILLENVAGLLVGGLGHVLGLMAEAGFNAEWGVFSCAGLGGSHRRERVFVLGYTWRHSGHGEWVQEPRRATKTKGTGYSVANPASSDVSSDWTGIRGELAGEVQQLAHPFRQRLEVGTIQHDPQRQTLERSGLPLWAPGPAADWSRIPETHWPAQFKVCSMADGVPRFMDEPNRTARLKALGNAVSPPVAAVAWRVLCDRIGR